MSILPRFGASALKYYHAILASAYEGLNTHDMWQKIYTAQNQYGLPTPQTQPPDVSVIRGFANKIVNGARTLARASNNDTITSDMMGYGAYTVNDYNTIAANPTYQVRYQVVWQKPDGTTETRWNTSVFTNTDFPDTVGELRTQIRFNADELIQQANQQVGGESGGTLLGTGSLEITVV